MKSSNFSIIDRVKSFKYAFNGLYLLLKNEHNSRIHFLAMILVVLMCFIYDVSVIEKCILVICIGFVFAMELVNSAIESLCDFVSTTNHDLIKKAKDMAAAGVLVAAIVSVIIAFYIFIPKIIHHV